MIEELVHRSNNVINNRTASFAMPWNENVQFVERTRPHLNRGLQPRAVLQWSMRSHTPNAVSFETYCGSSDVFENPRLNHAVDTCVVDIQQHLNEPGQPDWPTFGELERRCRLQRASSQIDGTPQLDCQRDCCILGWRSRTGHRSLNLHVHERAGPKHFCNRTLGVPTMFQHRWRNTVLVEGLGDVHHQKIDTEGLARHEIGGPARESTFAAVCQIAAVPVGPHSAALWRTVSHVVHPPQTANTRDVIGQHNHDCGFCLGIDGKFSPTVQWTGKRTIREPRPTSFLRTGLTACLTSGPPIPIIRLKIHHHMG